MATQAVASGRVLNVLEDFHTSVDAFIEAEIKNIQGPTNPTIDAARNVQLAIENTKYAHDEKTLLQTADQVDEKVKKELEALRGMIKALESREALANLSSLVNDYINGLPSIPGVPKLTKCPDYVAIEGNRFIERSRFFVSFTGVFEYAEKHGGCSLINCLFGSISLQRNC